MQKYVEEEPHKNPDGTACGGVRYDLKNCLLESDCVVKNHHSPKECLQLNDHTIPDQCKQLRQLFFDCKRSLLDMRTRFRGRKGY